MLIGILIMLDSVLGAIYCPQIVGTPVAYYRWSNFVVKMVYRRQSQSTLGSARFIPVISTHFKYATGGNFVKSIKLLSLIFPSFIDSRPAEEV